MDFKEIGLEFVDCSHLTQDTKYVRDLVNTVMKLWLP